MSLAANPQTVTYAGYRVTSAGAAVWPRMAPKYRWELLAAARTQLRADRRGYITTFVFGLGRGWRLSGTKAFSFGSSMGRFAEVLALACANAPADAEIDRATREIAHWGPRAMREQLRADPDRQFSAGSLVRQARNHRAWLEHGKALKAVDGALAREPSQGEALKLRLQLLAETGARRAKLVAAARQWQQACPDDAEAQSAGFGHGLEGNDTALVEPATEWLRRHPADVPLTFALSAFHFRRAAYGEAQAVLERCLPPEGDMAARAALRQQAEFVRRYAGDGWFRTRHRSKIWTARVLPWALAALFLTAKLSVTWRKSNPPAPRPQAPANDQLLKRSQERIAARDRKLQDLTGFIGGTFAALKVRADAGEAAAQYTVSFHYFRGAQGAPKDGAQGLRYLELAAAQHYLPAVRDLAEKLDQGKDVPRDVKRAVTLLEEAANLGSPRAARILGEHYQRGDGVEADLPRALAFYRQAAEQKESRAAERLFQVLRQGGEATEREEALRWMRAGAENGSKLLRYSWAAWVLTGHAANPEEENKIRGWMQELAIQGDAPAQSLMGEMSLRGILEAYDLKQAAKWHALAAEQEYPASMVTLAQLRAFGVGTPRDLPAARTLRAKVPAADYRAKSVEKLDRLLEISARPAQLRTDRGDLPPHVIWQEPSVFPSRLRREGVAGEATVELTVDEEGFVRDVIIVKATRPEFGYAAATAVVFWRFEPGMKDGSPVRTELVQPIFFTLTE